MTDKQPEALLYADKLEKVFGISEYADEIRRLHQSEREGWRHADEVEQERKRLHEVVDGFVLAAKKAEQAIDILWVSHHANRADHALELLRLALAKAEKK